MSTAKPRWTALVHDEALVAHRGVDVGEVADGVDDGSGHEREVGEGEALLLLPRGAGRPADLVDVGEVDLDGDQHVGRRGLGADHVLGGAAADVGERDDLVLLPGRRRRRRRGGGGLAGRRRSGPGGDGGRLAGPGLGRPPVEVGQDVVAGDAVVVAGAGDVVGVEVVLGDQPAHDGRQHPPAAPRVGCLRRAGARAPVSGSAARASSADAVARAPAPRAPAPTSRLPPPPPPPAASAAGFGVRAGLRPRPGRRSPPPPLAATVAGLVGDHRQLGADVDGLALLHQDLGEVAGGGRRHLGVDLVGGDLEQRLVGVDLVADLLEPLGDRALGDGFAQLRHRDVGHQPCSPLPVSDITASPNVSDSVGCGWM